MKKVKRGHHRIKQEAPEPLAGTSSASKPPEEKELAYYIHDRVELMHQVFSVLRSKEIRAMAPECVRNLSTGDLQELCLEELLGISSKRLCAILDGAEAPSDTSSSESDEERVECVSLDSISSVEQLSSEGEPSKKKRKCKRKEAKEKASKKAAKEPKTKAKKGEKSAKPSANAADKVQDPAKSGDARAAERAGMTVLELLELQARARAIRAQLSLEQTKKAKEASASKEAQEVEESDSDGSIEIKEEPAEVVLLSSSDEDTKPDKRTLDGEIENAKDGAVQSTVKKKNDLTIIVPSVQVHRKVKLNRNKSMVAANNTEVAPQVSTPKDAPVEVQKKNIETDNRQNSKTNPQPNTAKSSDENNHRGADIGSPKQQSKEKRIKEKKKKIKKKENKRKLSTGEGSDHDEITLQLSDTEKMDLLEGLDRKNYDNVSSSSEDSESSSEESENGQKEKEPEKSVQENDHNLPEKVSRKDNETEKCIENNIGNVQNGPEIKTQETLVLSKETEGCQIVEKDMNVNSPANETNRCNNKPQTISQSDSIIKDNVQSDIRKETENIPNKEESNELTNKNVNNEKLIEIARIDDIPVQEDMVECETSDQDRDFEDRSKFTKDDNSLSSNDTSATKIYSDVTSENLEISTTNCPPIQQHVENDLSVNKESDSNCKATDEHQRNNNELVKKPNENNEHIQESSSGKASDKEMSEGELSDRESSEVEIFEKEDEVVCISDEEIPKKKKKEKKKKEKKAKKDKKAKKNSDFHEGADQYFFDEDSSSDESPANTNSNKVLRVPPIEKDSDIEALYVICEISDDSSCYEVEGTLLSKEPTSEEIAALSAKIDTEIEREEVITEEQMQILENREKPSEENVEDVSWKDRWLDSKKVKKVLSTSSILNAMRKKNKELKNKLAESKKTEIEPEKLAEKSKKEEIIVEGSIEHFNTLQGSTKYVDPMNETEKDEENGEKHLNTEKANKDIKKDAKQLLKMYKCLLKFNSGEKSVDPNKAKKKKSKKQKKSKDKTK